MIDYDGITKAIDSEQNLEILRAYVVTVLGEIDQRHQVLAKLDPRDEPAFSPRMVETMRGKLRLVPGVDAMRKLGHEALDGLNAMNVQIERVRNRPRP